MTRYPRNMRGHGPTPPAANWPENARIAVQFVLNYEEGGENCVLHWGCRFGGIPVRYCRGSAMAGAAPLEYGIHL